MTDKDSFLSHWDNFTMEFRGKLLNSSKNTKINLDLASLFLKELVCSWGSDMEMNGRWLRKYTDSNPDKGKLIHDVIFNEVTVEEAKVKNKIPGSVKYIVPIVCAIIGYVLSYHFECSMVMKLVYTIVPAIIVYLVLNTMRKMQDEKIREDSISDYTGQLKKYEEKIVEIINK